MAQTLAEYMAMPRSESQWAKLVKDMDFRMTECGPDPYRVEAERIFDELARLDDAQE